MAADFDQCFFTVTLDSGDEHSQLFSHCGCSINTTSIAKKMSKIIGIASSRLRPIRCDHEPEADCRIWPASGGSTGDRQSPCARR